MLIIYSCRASPDSHFALSDHDIQHHPGCQNRTQIHLAPIKWPDNTLRTMLCLIHISSSFVIQIRVNTIGSFPTCQRKVPCIRKKVEYSVWKLLNRWMGGIGVTWGDVTTSRTRDGDWGRDGNGRLDGNWQCYGDGDGCLTMMDGGQQRDGYSTMIDGLTARSAMDRAMVTQDGNGWWMVMDGTMATQQW